MLKPPPSPLSKDRGLPAKLLILQNGLMFRPCDLLSTFGCCDLQGGYSLLSVLMGMAK
jgi:hypothetical protein